MIQISAIPVELLSSVWADVEPLLKMAIDESHGDVTVESTINGLIAKNSWLFVVTDEDKIVTAITAGVDTYESGKRVLMVRLAGGEGMHLWKKDALDLMKRLAREHLCSDVRLIGRKGWEKVAKPFGGKSIQTIISFGV